MQTKIPISEINAVVEEISSQAVSISTSKEGIIAFKSFFCNMGENLVIKVIDSIGEKGG